jgi:type VI secretion system protein ImpC
MNISETLKPLLTAVADLPEVPDVEPILTSERALRPTRNDQADGPGFNTWDHLASGLAILLQNSRSADDLRSVMGRIIELIENIESLINFQINRVLHDKNFYEMEQVWRSLENLVRNVNFKKDIEVLLLDVTKEELREDVDTNRVDISKSALFKQVYIDEYDQYGGFPFSSMVGLYEFDSSADDIDMLELLGKVANASHAPFIASVSPRFFRGRKTAAEISELKDIEGELQHPQYGLWNKFRDTEYAAYVGLTFPRFILRMPYDPDSNRVRSLPFFKEDVHIGTGEEDPEPPDRNADGYLWGSAAVLMARNLAKSFETSGWCQYIRGPKGGGLIEGLPIHTFMRPTREDGSDGDSGWIEDLKPPVEIVIPDYREYQFAKGGFIPLIYKKGTSIATFFSTQAAKAPKFFKDPKDSENSQLVTNLAYTMSITRIAHYIKMIMRENIGSAADEVYIQRILDNWVAKYVTTVQDPDRLTLRVYPFKAYSVDVAKKEGFIGQYQAVVSILPHIQFEGLDVELRIESRLG